MQEKHALGKMRHGEEAKGAKMTRPWIRSRTSLLVYVMWTLGAATLGYFAIGWLRGTFGLSSLVAIPIELLLLGAVSLVFLPDSFGSAWKLSIAHTSLLLLALQVAEFLAVLAAAAMAAVFAGARDERALTFVFGINFAILFCSLATLIWWCGTRSRV